LRIYYNETVFSPVVEVGFELLDLSVVAVLGLTRAVSKVDERYFLVLAFVLCKELEFTL
jgi:hypothetical protein